MLVAASSSALGSTSGNTVIVAGLATSRLGLQGDITLAEPMSLGGRQPLPNASALAAHLVNLSGTNAVASPMNCVMGGTLAGTGVVAESLVIQSAGTLAPGFNDTPGSLTVRNNLTLSGCLLIGLNRSLAPSNSSVTVNGTITNTRTAFVNLTNFGLSLVAGDRFKIFSRAVSNGVAMAILPAPGPGLAWSNQLALDGSLAVVATYVGYPTNLTVTLGGSQMTFSWPATHLGWILQAQTNSPAVGLSPSSSQWFDLPGSHAATQYLIMLEPWSPCVFHRLRGP